MPRRVEIINKTRAYDKYIFRIDEVTLRYETYAGAMKEVTRLNLDRGDSAAALVHNRDRNTLLFTEQFRYSTYEKGPGWLLELPAGIVEDGEDPRITILRELEEEIGYRSSGLHLIATFYVSPGGTSERIHLYYIMVNDSDKVTDGGGLEHEGEDIRLVELPVAEIFRRMDHGEINDAKTLIGLQWLRLQGI
jgi:ADP-ribose pyrophosphatase